MTTDELRNKIKELILLVMADMKKSGESSLPFEELTKFPQLKRAVVDLLTPDFGAFLEDIEWVAPRPSTFRIKLLNGSHFLLIYDELGWIANVKGKKYDLSNIDSNELAAKSISRMLSYEFGNEEEYPNDIDVEDASNDMDKDIPLDDDAGGADDFEIPEDDF